MQSDLTFLVLNFRQADQAFYPLVIGELVADLSGKKNANLLIDWSTGIRL